MTYSPKGIKNSHIIAIRGAQTVDFKCLFSLNVYDVGLQLIKTQRSGSQ